MSLSSHAMTGTLRDPEMKPFSNSGLVDFNSAQFRDSSLNMSKSTSAHTWKDDISFDDGKSIQLSFNTHESPQMERSNKFTTQGYGNNFVVMKDTTGANSSALISEPATQNTGISKNELIRSITRSCNEDFNVSNNNENVSEQHNLTLHEIRGQNQPATTDSTVDERIRALEIGVMDHRDTLLKHNKTMQDMHNGLHNHQNSITQLATHAKNTDQRCNMFVTQLGSIDSQMNANNKFRKQVHSGLLDHKKIIESVNAKTNKMNSGFQDNKKIIESLNAKTNEMHSGLLAQKNTIRETHSKIRQMDEGLVNHTLALRKVNSEFATRESSLKSIGQKINEHDSKISKMHVGLIDHRDALKARE